MKTFASLFSGFGGADIGAIQAGLKPIWGVEYDADIADAAKTNGLDFMVADVREVDYSTLETPWWLHMSPVCKRASTANANAKEVAEDIETAQACVRAIVALRPPFLSLENVRGYESFSAFHLIVRCLMDEGYNVAWWVLNSADYGVPQTRERLCLIASRTERVRKPIQTHAKEPPHDAQLSMFDTPTVKRWVGWHEAIEDLLPGLEDTKLAEWQWKFMPDEIKTMLIDGKANMYGSSVTMRDPNSPAFTIPASNGALHGVKAVLVDGTKQVHGMAVKESHDPAPTVLASTGSNRPTKALLFDGRNYRYGDITVLEDEKPSFTVTATNGVERYKAVLIDSSNSGRNGKSTRFADEPALTATTKIQHKAVLCADMPYRIVKLNSRCLARFQAFPDWYKLPDSNKLACTGIGNAKPSALQQVEIEAQIASQKEIAA